MTTLDLIKILADILGLISIPVSIILVKRSHAKLKEIEENFIAYLADLDDKNETMFEENKKLSQKIIRIIEIHNNYRSSIAELIKRYKVGSESFSIDYENITRDTNKKLHES